MARRRRHSASPSTGGTRSGNAGSNTRLFPGSSASKPSLLRVYTTLRIPANAARVKYVGRLRPSSDGTSFKLPPVSSRSLKGQKLVSRRVLLLIPRPKRFERFSAQVTVRKGRVHISTGAKGRIAAQASHQPDQDRRHERKGQQKAGGHSASLHSRLGRVHRVTLSGNATSARKFDLASAFVLGRPVRR